MTDAPKVRYCDAGGGPTAEQLNYVRKGKLYQHGDAVLVWVNEGDILRSGQKEAGHDPQKPIGWVTEESWQRLKAGGNDSRATVPLHAERTSHAKIPLFVMP